jgi:hypothetical protein
MDVAELIEIFEALDVEKPLPIQNDIILRGQIQQSNIEKVQFSTLEKMHDIKFRTRFLSDSEKLIAFEQINHPIPQLKKFDTNKIRHKDIEAAIFRGEMDFYNFTIVYKDLLKARIEKEKKINRPEKNLKSLNNQIGDLHLIFLQALNEPKFARVEFWENGQQNSIYSKQVFWMKLAQALTYYNTKIDKEIIKWKAQGNDINNYNLPLTLETGFTMIGTLNKEVIRELAESVNELSKKWDLENSKEATKHISITSKTEFDLKKYDVQAPVVTPYSKVIHKEDECFIYEGALGNNRFNYFKIQSTSEAGKLLKEFDEKYIKNNGLRHNAFEDWLKLIELSETQAIEKETGLNAYLKYWNDALTYNDKVIIDFYVIVHFEALKEWYNLKLEKYIENNESRYLDEEVKDSDIQRWHDDIKQSVELYLKQSERKPNQKFSTISSVHAKQLILFYYWLDIKVEISKSIEEKSVEKKIDKVSCEQYIKSELIDRLTEVESKMKIMIDSFSQSKIKCAAWVELLMDKGYFNIEHKKTNLKSCTSFAKARYNVDITNQMKPAKNGDRNNHKKRFFKYLK